MRADIQQDTAAQIPQQRRAAAQRPARIEYRGHSEAIFVTALIAVVAGGVAAILTIGFIVNATAGAKGLWVVAPMVALGALGVAARLHRRR